MDNDEEQDIHINRRNPGRDEIKNDCISMIEELEDTLLKQSEYVHKIYRTVLGKKDIVIKFYHIFILS